MQLVEDVRVEVLPASLSHLVSIGAGVCETKGLLWCFLMFLFSNFYSVSYDILTPQGSPGSPGGPLEILYFQYVLTHSSQGSPANPGLPSALA